jgi:4-nitrophenyl phosphatase
MAGDPGTWSGVKAIALDLDGVVYQGSRPLAGAPGAVRAFRDRGIKVYFVTNNSGKSRAEIAAKLRSMGIEAVEGEVLNAAYAAGVLIRELNPGRSASVKAIGGAGLEAELALAGHRLSPGDRADYLVVGLDTAFGYERIAEGLEALLGGAVFVACNRDANYPAEGGRLLPGCGAMVSALEAASGVPAKFEAGKPNPLLLRLIAEAEGIGPGEILVIGDGIESDLAMARAFGSPWALVSSAHNAGESAGAATRSFVSLEAVSSAWDAALV